MEVAFTIAALVAIATTVRVITCANTVHALLYLIVSLLATAIVFYTLGARFAAALEVIIYAGAVMVLFVFVLMMLNLNAETIARERRWLRPEIWIGPGIMAAVLLAAMITALTGALTLGRLNPYPVSPNAVGIQLFGPYVLVAELSAFLLLAALVVAAHIGRGDRDVDRESAERAEAERGERLPPAAGKSGEEP